MTDVEINVDATSPQLVLTRLADFVSRTMMDAFLMGPVNEWFKHRAEQRFDHEGDDVSGAWLPLREATVGIRQDQGYPGEHPINERTGALRRWITNDGALLPGGADARIMFPGGVPEADPYLGVKLKTAQQGRDYPMTSMRPVLGYNEVDIQAVADELAGWFLKAMGV